MKDKINKMDDLLISEKYNELLIETQSINQINPTKETLLYQGVAHYKLNEYPEADIIFESIIGSNDNIDIMTYKIITKLKLNRKKEATQLYTELCKKENNHLKNMITDNDVEAAISLCLFLISIPINIESTVKDGADIMQLINAMNYKLVVDRLSNKNA